MSDAFMSTSDEDAGDFSASEDEWLPGKSDGTRGNRERDKSSAGSASSSGDSELPSDAAGGDSKSQPARKKNSSKGRFSKTNLNSSTKRKHEGSSKSTNAPGTRAAKQATHDDSDSSGDEYLVDPTQLDLNSKFFDAVRTGGGDGLPSFDCNAGLGKLTDSSEDETDPTEKGAAGDSGTIGGGKKLIAKINETSQAYVNFQDFTSTLEKAKAHFQTATQKQQQQQQERNQPGGTLDVSHLLALGETSSSVRKTVAPVPKATTSTRGRKAPGKKPADSDSDWEEVEEGAQPTGTAGPDGKTVQITLRPEAAAKKKKKCTELDVDACIKRMINRDKRDAQLILHKMTIIMGIAHGDYTNTVLNNPALLAIANGLIPSERCYPKGRTNLGYFEQILKYFREIVDLKDQRWFVRSWKRLTVEKSLRLQLLSQMANCKRDYILLFVILLRSIGAQCRMVMSLQVVPKNVPTAELLKVVSSNGKKGPAMEADNANVKGDHDYDEKKGKKPVTSGRKRKVSSLVEIPQLDGADDAKRKKRPKQDSNSQVEVSISPRKTRQQRLGEASKKEAQSVKELTMKKKAAVAGDNKALENNPSAVVKNAVDCIPSTSKMVRRDYSQKAEEKHTKQLRKSETPVSGSPGKKIVKIERFSASTRRALDRRVLSTDDETKHPTNGPVPAGRGSHGVNVWVEVYAEEEERWIPVDVARGLLHCVDNIVSQASSPMLYVLAWSNDGSIKDVSARYCAQYATVTQKLRIMQQWMDNTLLQFRGERTARDIREDRELNRILEERPLPKTIAEYKSHPYFALKRHLLKFEAIYPPDAPTLGFTSNKEPVYARECVHTLHAREVWLKQARTVKLYETPYKIVSARPKYNRASGQMEPAQKPLELFGHWQTEEYEPPTAEDGIVPRNAYGNVELFKPCMLPKKTVHLRLPCLNRICKKLRIDCAQAVTGFDFHGGSSHPVYDGFVVCEEYRDLVVDAWHQEQEAEEQRARDKYEKRVYGNWKRLIKGLLIRRKLQHKYNFDNLNQ
uniref:Rad4 beta-hairpin domain-containing protein n=1 Tax=Anopheles atroparvus TaxID=41427 RepID=A0AAG5CQY3_ANOAO